MLFPVGLRHEMTDICTPWQACMCRCQGTNGKTREAWPLLHEVDNDKDLFTLQFK